MKFLPASFFLPTGCRRRAASWRGLLAGALLLTPLALSATPANDNFANAQALTGAMGMVQGSNVGATPEANEPSFLEEYGGASVWYTWSSSTTVLAVFTTGGSNFDTILGVYTGSNVATLTEVATDDDYGDSLNSEVTFVAHAGTVYHIAVDGYGAQTGAIVLSYDSAASTAPLITSANTETVEVNTAFTYHIVATNSPTGYTASGLPAGLTLNGTTGLISGKPTAVGQTDVILGATNASGSSNLDLRINVISTPVHPAFFTGEEALSNGVYYLDFTTGNYFGYYSYLTDPAYIYHFDLGYEYVFDANDGNSGVYLYDFASQDFFYTSPGFPFPYLYDFGLKSTVYYYPDPSNYGHYNTNGVRYFYVFSTGQIISK